MAVDIGPRIGIEGEAEYRKQINDIITQTKTLHAEMRSMESAWDKDTSAKQKAAQQTQALNQQIDLQKQRIDELNRGLEASAQKYGENDTRTLKWRQAVANATTELHQMEAELRKIPNNLQIVGQQMQSVGDKMTKIGTGMSKYVTAPIVAVGTAAVKTASDFDTSMSKVRALSGATGDDYDRLREKAREMGATTKYSATESADALGYMALAGWDTNQMVDGLDGVMNLAAASGMDLAEASDIVTDYLSAFGLEAADATKMADEMAYAQAHSNTTTTQLGEAFGNSAARMHTAGQSMETTTALLEAFANQGTKGSEAGTQLAATMRDIGNAMEDGHIQIGDTSIAVQDQNGNFRNLIDILADVEKATEGMGTAEKQAALQAVFTRNSYNAVSQALTEGTENIKQYEQELYSASGTAKTMAEVMQDNLAGEITKLKSALQELGISLGDTLVPMVRDAVEWLQGMVDKFNSLDDTTKENIVKLGLVAAAIGPVLTVVGKATSGIGSLVETFGKLSAGMTTIPFGPVALAITGVATAIGLVIAANEAQRQAYEEANEEVYKAIDASEDARESLKKTGDEIGTAFDEANDSIAMATERAEMAHSMVDRLEELVSAEKLSSAEMVEAKSIVSQLNATYPGLNAQIDENGKLLGKSTEEMRGFIDSALETATVEAKQQALTNALKELTDATTAKIEAQARAKQVTEELDKAESEYKNTIDELNAARESGEISASEYGYKIMQLNSERSKSINDLQTEQTELNTAIDEHNAKIAEATDKYNTEKEIIDETVGSITGETEATQDATTATDEYGTEVSETATILDAYGNSVDAATGEIVEYKDAATQAYMEAYDSAKQSLDSQKNMFDRMSISAAHSADEIASAMNSQSDTYNRMADDMETAWNYAVRTGDAATQDLIRQIANLGVEGSGDMAQLAQAIRDGNFDIVNSWSSMSSNVNSSKDRYAQILAQTQSNTVQTTNGIVWPYDSAGRQIMQSVGSTGANAQSSWNNAMNGMANTTSTNMNTVQGQVATGMSNAQGAVQGSEYGMRSASQNVFGAIEAQARLATGNMYSYGADAMSRYQSGMWSGQYGISSAAQYISGSLSGYFDIGSSAHWWGRNLGVNFSNGIYASGNAIRNAAAYVASIAAAYLHHSTPDKGPLHDDDKWGGEMVANFTDAMREEIPYLRRTALDVAGAAAISRDGFTYDIPQSGAAQIGQALQGVAGTGDDITINVYASEGMNVNQLADQVQQRLALVQRQRASAYA